MAVNLENIRIILVETSHPGNIGAAARAMKTMGLTDLWLVNPGQFPCAEATARAAGADSVLEAATVVDTLDDALEGCCFVMGTTARKRSLTWPVVNPREAACSVEQELSGGRVALVFGRERSGLTNDQMVRCHKLINIPSNPEYSSLNLAAAVQVLSYELRMQFESGRVNAGSQGDSTPGRPEEALATAENMASYFSHLERTLVSIGFLDSQNPGRLIPRLRRLYARARPTLNEINILRGILTETDRSIVRASENKRGDGSSMGKSK